MTCNGSFEGRAYRLIEENPCGVFGFKGGGATGGGGGGEAGWDKNGRGRVCVAAAVTGVTGVTGEAAEAAEVAEAAEAVAAAAI